MGSIPVVSLDDTYESHTCPNAFLPFYMRNSGGASSPATSSRRQLPFVVVKDWTQLEDTLDRLFFRTASPDETARRLDEFQARLLQWYQPFMEQTIQSFEDKVLEHAKQHPIQVVTKKKSHNKHKKKPKPRN